MVAEGVAADVDAAVVEEEVVAGGVLVVVGGDTLGSSALLAAWSRRKVQVRTLRQTDAPFSPVRA